MPYFRARPREASDSAAASALSLTEVRQLIAEVVQPGHFFVGSPFGLEWQHCLAEESSWEVYQGRLLDPAHTRSRRTFESWNIFARESGQRSAEPILSLKLDRGTGQLHVTRALHCYAWEGYHGGGNVYLSRETQKWVRELVGSIRLDRFHDLAALRDEIICLLFQAVVGCSRLPLQSMEAPLPAFSLGRLAYFYQSNNQPPSACLRPMQSFRELIEQGLQNDLSWSEKAKLLETVLRSTARDELDAAAEVFMSRWRILGHSGVEFMALCRTLFNDVALSPYTDFVDKWLFFLSTLESRGLLAAEAQVDFLSYMLRQNVRHLTAYDLLTFHHRGANYPDALLLNQVLQAYLALIDRRPDLFLSSGSDDALGRKQKQLRRRALRQGWLLRRMIEGLPVPEVPTSPGENARVLPPPFERVPEEQIFEPGKRTKRLFEGEPLLFAGEPSRLAMQQSVTDLEQLEELQELGMAIFLERPLGIGKAAMEPDRTLLFSYEAFSLATAVRRLQFLAAQPACNLNSEACARCHQALLSNPRRKGIPLPPGRTAPKPGAVALHDAARVAADFLVLCTTRRAVTDFLHQFDFTALGRCSAVDFLQPHQRLLIVSASSTRFGPEGILDVYDAQLQKRLELQVDLSGGYESRAGQEYPAAGLRVLRAWEAGASAARPQEQNLESQGIILPPRDRV